MREAPRTLGLGPVLVLTGAGISAASGLPTYRGPGGIYQDGGPRRRVAHRDFLDSPPEEVWAHYGPLRSRVQNLAPNAGHLALVELERRLPHGSVTVATQNVDGLHQRAGSARVLELHGTLLRSRCQAEGCGVGYPDLEGAPGAPPRCRRCGRRVRPDVVLFGERSHPEVKRRARRAASEASRFLAVGTSGQVSSARELLRLAREGGARTVYVGLDHQPRKGWSFDEVHEGRAEELLPELLRAWAPPARARIA